MTEEQIKNYNYLYYNDSIYGTDYADEFIGFKLDAIRENEKDEIIRSKCI